MNEPRPESIALLYHGIDPGDGRFGRLSPLERAHVVSSRTFERHLDILAEKGRNFLAPRFYMRRAAEAIPEGGDVVLTFDGGWASDYEIVLPILRKRKLRALFFVTTSLVGEPGRVTWDQLNEMATMGMVIGAHGHSHRHFTDMSISYQRLEFELAHDQLVERIRMQATAFSFPGGRYFRGCAALAGHYGFTHCFASTPIEREREDDVWVLGRWCVGSEWSPAVFADMLDRQDDIFQRERLAHKWRRLGQALLGDRAYSRLVRWYCSLKRRKQPSIIHPE